jgi:DNA primase
MPTYSTALLDEIRMAVDIVELIGRFVNLKKAGANWKGLCPFHGEKTPSFMVNPAKGIFHCFGCGVGGDAFGFLMRQDRLSFPEAVRALAKTAGVTLPEERGPGDGGGRDELHRAMELAAKFYADNLWGVMGGRARDYLDKRGIDPEVARRFGLGFAPDEWRALGDVMRTEGVSEETMVTVGLAVAREDGKGGYDRFRGRLLFPIRDLQGRVVAFGGRAFGDEQPKYLNSPETPLYTKGNLLYAIDLARETIRGRNRALLVEGYVDCLMAHQHGFTETVAALGTAFTAAQLGLLRRYCDEVVTFFDADAAGQKAAERAEELIEPSAGGAAWAVNRSGSFEAAGALRLKVALLPSGHDPDTFLQAHGAAAFTERIDAARSLLAYALDRIINESAGASAAAPRGRANAFARVALMLAKVSDSQEAAALSREAALKLGVDPTQLWTESRKLQAALGRPITPARPAAPPSPEMSWIDRDVLPLLLHFIPARARLLPLLEPADFSQAPLQRIVAALKERQEAPAELLLTDLGDEEARNRLTALLLDEPRLENAESPIRDFEKRLGRLRHQRRAREVWRGIAESQQQSGGKTTAAPEELRILHQESAVVYESVGGVAQPLDHRPAGREEFTG